MSIQVIARCDYCPAVRDPAKNHWWVISTVGASMSIHPWIDDPDPSAKHACSDDCVLLAVKRHLGRQRDARLAETGNAQLEKQLLAEPDHTPLMEPVK